MTCTHEIWERDAAATGDGLCPLCLQADLARYRAGIEQLLVASKSLSRVNKLDGLTLQQFCERPSAMREARYGGSHDSRTL